MEFNNSQVNNKNTIILYPNIDVPILCIVVETKENYDSKFNEQMCVYHI